MRILIFALTLLWTVPALAVEVVPVGTGIYALVGDLGQRAPGNLGNNATFGAVVTDDGVVLIDSGGSAKGAAALAAAIRTVTDKPVALVINTGGQDHRWLGNGYFKARGARIIASAAAVADQAERFDAQYQGLTFLIGADGVAGTEAVQADETFAADLDIDFGGVRFQLRHRGGAHTPGDAFVWLPDAKVVFTGDIVYLERLLGVIDVSDTVAWLDSFAALAALNPVVLVPGHGHPADLKAATAQTLDYVRNLRTKIRAVLDEGGEIAQGTDIDQSAFEALSNFDSLARRNAQAVFIEMEFE